MKVIFLDIDGVLCTRRAWSNRPKTYSIRDGTSGEFHKPVIKMFEKWLIENPEVQVVLSSTWRGSGRPNPLYPEFAWQNRIGKESPLLVSRIVGVTGHHVEGIRGLEIAKYLQDHTDITHWAIVDDDDYDQFDMDHFVKTKTQIGLTHAHLREVERILEL